MELNQDVIEGAMVLRQCSREDAIEWLTSPPTEEELAEWRPLVARQNPAEKVEEITSNVAMRARYWDAIIAPRLKAIRESQILTADDYNTRVGPC